MKKISIVVPCYNDSNSIMNIRNRVSKVFENELKEYDYEIIYVDDCSPDDTWKEIERVCSLDSRCKGVHNFTNFGPDRNIFQSLKYGEGDAVFLIYGDLQQPPEVLPEFIRYWEEGYNSIIGVQPNSHDGFLKRMFRNVYYKFVGKASGKKLIPGFANFGLYDKDVIAAFRKISNVRPSIPGLIAEYGGKIWKIPVEQRESERGKSNFNFIRKYDVAMVNITSYTKILLRMATFVGGSVGIVSIVFALISVIMKICDWDNYPMGIPSIIFGVFFIGGMQLFFLGIIGEYIIGINERSMNKPVVICDKTININEELVK